MSPFSPADLRRIKAHGLARADAERQARLAKEDVRPPELVRPCRAGDGVLRLSAAERGRLERLGKAAARQGRLLQFVPASGAASRMFQPFSDFLSGGTEDAEVAALRRRAGKLPFPIHGDLRDLLGRLAGLAKGLLPFHSYPGGPRTAFEEQLVESAGDIRRFHFTVSPEHARAFRALARRVVPQQQRRWGCRFRVEFSIQAASTDTLAFAPAGRPFRDAAGRLLFRPGGHGALLDNLGRLKGDIVIVKTIDNVPVESRMPAVRRWKKILAGLLADIQDELYRRLRELEARPAALVAARAFARKRLSLDPPADAAALAGLLHRPLRVCGMVRNTGEPGGGPFWVREKDGTLSRQIVESAQVGGQPRQRRVFARGTHFNPVCMALGLRDHRGRPYDLKRHADPDAMFISHKRRQGRPVLALERPGLWNGAMARWNTVFVEIPLNTFHPVKTVVDLLRPGHQGGKRKEAS